MTTPKTTAFFKQLLHHVSLRVTLDQQQQDLFLNMFQIRSILPRQYLLQQGDVCRYESYVCKGFLHSFIMDNKGKEHTLHFAMEDWWISDLGSFVNQEPQAVTSSPLSKPLSAMSVLE
jgi:CRP-like cAMP-binding protein